MALYYKKLKNSIVIKDLTTHKNTVPVLKKHINVITDLYPELACEFFELLTVADGIPKRSKYRKFVGKLFRCGCIPKSIPLAIFAMEKCFKK